jgi:hypothetical protein
VQLEKAGLAATSRPSQGRSTFTLVSLMVLVGIEVFAVALAGGWAIAGLFELGQTISYVLMALFSLLALYMMVQFWRRATTVQVR